MTVRCLANGATYIQRRTAPAVNFTRGWDDYVNGFGDPDDFWLGLQNIYYFTNSRDYKLGVGFVDSNGTGQKVKYKNFVLTENVNYTVSLGAFDSSNHLGDLLSDMNGQRFSTFDNDNDNSTTRSCAMEYEGGGGGSTTARGST
nr:hypothetical protein BaRGS_001286 [Batillaria attramentaria]